MLICDFLLTQSITHSLPRQSIGLLPFFFLLLQPLSFLEALAALSVYSHSYNLATRCRSFASGRTSKQTGSLHHIRSGLRALADTEQGCKKKSHNASIRVLRIASSVTTLYRKPRKVVFVCLFFIRIVFCFPANSNVGDHFSRLRQHPWSLPYLSLTNTVSGT